MTPIDNSPVLKTGWERFKSHVSLDVPTAEKLFQSVTQNKIAELSLCAEGLANTSYKVTFTSHHPPVILRIYLREHSACQREFALHTLLKDKVPIAQIIYVDTSCNIIPYPFAVMEWVEGMLMREVVLSGEEEAIQALAFEAGRCLAILREITVQSGGFFQEDLTITPFAPDETSWSFCFSLLEKPVIKTSLGHSWCDALYQLIETNKSFYPDPNETNLTHADYDPANIF